MNFAQNPTGAPSEEDLLVASGLRAGYGQLMVVRDVSLLVARGECVALLGPNGSGKTTLLRTLAGLQRLRSGKIIAGGVDVSGWPAWKRARHGLGMVPDRRAVFGTLSVHDNLRGFGDLHGAEDLLSAHTSARDALVETFQFLETRADEPASRLSGGQQTLLAIAQAMSLNPSFLLIDEPSAGLSPAAVQTVGAALELLKERHIGILLAEQDPRFSERVADREVQMLHGEVSTVSLPSALASESVLRTE